VKWATECGSTRLQRVFCLPSGTMDEVSLYRIVELGMASVGEGGSGVQVVCRTLGIFSFRLSSQQCQRLHERITKKPHLIYPETHPPQQGTLPDMSGAGVEASTLDVGWLGPGEHASIMLLWRGSLESVITINNAPYL
jgi:hypothetical protein